MSLVAQVFTVRLPTRRRMDRGKGSLGGSRLRTAGPQLPALEGPGEFVRDLREGLAAVLAASRRGATSSAVPLPPGRHSARR